MSWVDCGVNLLDKRFTLPKLYARAKQAKVQNLVAIASSIEEFEQIIDYLDSANYAIDKSKYDISVSSTAGVHPHYADACDTQTWINLKSITADNKIAAIGECGLDFNRNYSSPKNQMYAFEKQLELAAEHNMGVYLHERDAFETQFAMLEQYSDSLRFMLAHCFTGNTEQLQAYLSLGCFVGLTGWLCDEKRGISLREAVKSLPLSRLVLETDSPYLFPKNVRPRKSLNEPCNIPFIAEELAKITGHSIDIIQEHSSKNAKDLFFTEKNTQ